MIGKISLAAGVIALGTLVGSSLASAASVAPGVTGPALSVVSSAVEKVQFGGCCAWRHECARRWGWGGFNFRRCLARHGCM